MTLDIKVLGNWTRGLQDLASRFDPSRYAHTCVFMDQFHGSSHMQMQGYLNHPSVLMVAGGIGITPMISALRMLVNDGTSLPKIRRAVLVWVVRKESVVDLYRDELGYYQSLIKTKTGCELDVIVHATLSEKEDTDDFVAVEVDSHKPKHAASRTSTHKQWPFQQSVMGYWHLLVLTVGAGGGYLLGIFLANFFALDKTWRFEYGSLLQISLAVFFDAFLVAIGMSRSFCRRGAAYSAPTASPTSTKMGQFSPERLYRELSSVSLEDANNSSSKRAETELNVVLGCRPDLEKIIANMKDWCEANECFSVGVSVCGPDQLIRQVMTTCRKASTPSLPFVVDDESFEW